nr:methyl-accepting chemotaxis protein [Nitrospiraceae bacterium]
NAAIEAARAGEQGRGFAVVADEVRKLAEKTIRATSEISGKISSVQQESTETVNSMKGATAEVSRATQYIKSVGQALESIVTAVQKVSDQMAHISTAIDEQSATTTEVSRHIEETAAISNDIEASSGEVLNGVLSLSNIAEEMREAASGIKTKGGAVVMIEIAKNDHKNFVEKIASCVDGKKTMTASQLPDHHSCRFGKWYYKEGQALCSGMSSYKLIEDPHEKIHRLAKDALTQTQMGDREKADRSFNELKNVSQQMLGMLDDLKRDCA